MTNGEWGNVMSGPVINSYKDLLVWQDAITFVQFLRIAQGSLKEVETHLFLSLRVEIASARDIDPLIEKSERLGKMLRGLIRSLQDKV